MWHMQNAGHGSRMQTGAPVQLGHPMCLGQPVAVRSELEVTADPAENSPGNGDSSFMWQHLQSSNIPSAESPRNREMDCFDSC